MRHRIQLKIIRVIQIVFINQPKTSVMKLLPKITCLAFACMLLNSCKKDTKPAAPVSAATAPCIVNGESTSLVGNEKSFTYQFNDKGEITKVNMFNSVGTLTITYEASSNTVIATGIATSGGKNHRMITEYQGGDIFDGLPT